MTAAWERMTGIISGVFASVAQSSTAGWSLVGAIRPFGRRGIGSWRPSEDSGAGCRPAQEVPGRAGLQGARPDRVRQTRRPRLRGAGAGHPVGGQHVYFPRRHPHCRVHRRLPDGFLAAQAWPTEPHRRGRREYHARLAAGLYGCLAPARKTCGRVNAAWQIGTFTNQQVEKRIAQLDAALQPFIDRLDIAKAKMEALIEPLRGVQDALQKKLARQLERFTKGEVDAEAVRGLDRQNAALSERIQAPKTSPSKPNTSSRSNVGAGRRAERCWRFRRGARRKRRGCGRNGQGAAPARCRRDRERLKVAAGRGHAGRRRAAVAGRRPDWRLAGRVG